ncbi:hypothetical protein BN961_00551 [Afipia felis]|uniref:DUF768 domain-containing protein n=1 Tax=Afipia felis TaxID=1035 RepID=A0A090MNA6_AFIFE|nr:MULTISPECIES: hypothetical protein [Afipia]EFI52348.1 hypothetical protein AfiDRAFT_0334 [Afipia sp. 1NLS2]CEG07169.1 hypothetical protein BN961_00551 [Afipia felis]
MVTNAKEFIDFWVANSVHAKLELGEIGSSQSADELARRLLEAANQLGLSSDDIVQEIGDPAEYIKAKLREFNVAESDRRDPHS